MIFPKNCNPLGYYAPISGNSLPTFREKLSDPYPSLVLEDGTGWLFQNVGKKVTLFTA